VACREFIIDKIKIIIVFLIISLDLFLEEREIIMHAKTSCLHSSGNYWGKWPSSSLFDVKMGSFDSAESCELVGSYLLHLITTKHGNNFGLYRYDVLGLRSH
jgi:hypothetical protein